MTHFLFLRFWFFIISNNQQIFNTFSYSIIFFFLVEVPPWPRSIGWYNDNGIVNEGPLYHLMADGLGMYGVEIKSLRADHSTTWKCIATSSTGAKAVTSCVVSVSCNFV
jgi:hypothetical protein